MADYTQELNMLNSSFAGLGSTIGAANLDKANKEFAREEAEKQRDWNEMMYNKQNAWNYEMWQKANEYNSPTSQYQRLRDAGLNPMFYGLDGTGNADGLTAAQPLGYDRANYASTINPIAHGIDAALKTAQVANIQADTAKKGQETVSEVQRREKVQAEIENIKQTNNNLLAQEGLTNAQREQIEKNNAWLDRINEATVAEKEANAALNQSQKNRIDELLEGEKLLQVKSAEDFDHKWSKIRAEIAKMAKETGLLEKDIENYALNHMSNGFMGSGVSLQNLFRAGRDEMSNTSPSNRQRQGDAAGLIYDNK